MQGLVCCASSISRAKRPLLISIPCLATSYASPVSASWKCVETGRLSLAFSSFKAHASNFRIASGNYEGGDGAEQKLHVKDLPIENSSNLENPHGQIQYILYIGGVLFVCYALYSLITSVKGPSFLLSAIPKSGFTAAFSLIFVSEIGDKTFFIAALLAMQFQKGLVLFGSMGALSLMSVLSVVIGQIFHSVPAQFQTSFPIGEYGAIGLLLFFGLKSIKDAWDLPSNVVKSGANNSNPDLDEFVAAEELVNEKVSKGSNSNPLEVVWKSFSLIFFAEWGDRSMLATIALGAAKSPWGVAAGAIAGHLLATSMAIIGGAFLGNYISEKIIGYLGGVLFLLFAAATIFGIF